MEETLTYRVSQQVLDVNFILETIKFAIFAKLEFKRILTFFVFFNFFFICCPKLDGTPRCKRIQTNIMSVKGLFIIKDVYDKTAILKLFYLLGGCVILE